MTDPLIALASFSSELPAAPPDWVQLLPYGTIKGRDGRGPWSLPGMAAAQQVIAASLTMAGPVKPVIDYDHAVDLAAPHGGQAPAAGWIAAFEARPDGIWGRVEWTQRAAAKIAAREYRYVSPVFRHTKEGAVTCILRAALVNNPAFELKALASMGAPMSPETIKRLCALLNLPDTSDEAAVIEAVTKLVKDASEKATAAAVPDPSLYVPRHLYDEAATQLASMRTNLSEEQATAKVDAAIRAGKMTPAQREWGLVLCRSNPASFDQFAASAPPVFGNLAREVVPGGRPPDPNSGADGRLTAEQKAICAALGHDPAEYAKNL
ncbi:MAG TPA: phage protease [Azospirillum sp.]|nr:phage protease [Azospirillum sp.]